MWKMKEMTRHHRRCRANNGKTTKRNCILIKDNLHRAYHTIFGSMTPPEVAKLLTEVYIDPDYRMVAELKPRRKRNKQLKLDL